MNGEIKQLWLEALRSGKYLKGKNRLRTNDNAFCCLGVLCDLHAKVFNCDWEAVFIPGKGKYAYLNKSHYLPEKVQEWAGLTDVYRDKEEQCLTTLNDKLDSFTEIANYIETNL